MMTNRKAECLEMNGSGFTLIEVLVAIVILSVALLGMATLTISIIHGNKLSNDLTTATTLAQDKMEEIRGQDYASVTSDPKAACPSPYDNYQIKVEITDDSPATDMKHVVVTTYWNDNKGNEHNVEMKTILAK